MVVHALLQWLIGAAIIFGGVSAVTLVIVALRYFGGVLLVIFLLVNVVVALTEGLREIGAEVLK